jgi:4-carboxymuconolactone decarboxylase
MTRLPERLPPPGADRMDEDQRAAMAELQGGPRGAVVGPFGVLVRRPELLRRYQRVGEYLRYGGGLSPRVFELTVLLVARAYDQDFEWDHHRPLAERAGLEPEVLAAIEGGRSPAWRTAADEVVARVVGELLTDRTLSDTGYADGVRLLGEDLLVELVAAVGYYVTLALLMNTAGTPSTGAGLRPHPATVRGGS